MLLGVKLKFVSKKNTVMLRDGLVEKHFSSESSAAFEAQALKHLQTFGVRVPRVMEQSGCVLKLEYIPGETLPDYIERLESSSWTTLDICTVAEAVVNWLSEFYRAVDTDKTGEIRGDVNGRNYIFDGVHCIGVDFEERTHGEKEQDIGLLIAYILNYDPPETIVKKAFADRLLSAAVQVLGVDSDKVIYWRGFEVMKMLRRRKHRTASH